MEEITIVHQLNKIYLYEYIYCISLEGFFTKYTMRIFTVSACSVIVYDRIMNLIWKCFPG